MIPDDDEYGPYVERSKRNPTGGIAIMLGFVLAAAGAWLGASCTQKPASPADTLKVDTAYHPEPPTAARAAAGPRGCLSLDIPTSQVKRVHDGDTFTLYSVGVTNEEQVRVLGVNAPELGTGPAADSATAFTKRWVQAGTFQISACKRDKYGRLLASVTRAGKNLADTLITLKLGVKDP